MNASALFLSALFHLLPEDVPAWWSRGLRASFIPQGCHEAAQYNSTLIRLGHAPPSRTVVVIPTAQKRAAQQMEIVAVDLIVLGAGIAGLAAARHAARSGLRVVCFESLMFGGLVTNINELSPAPAGVSGSGIDFASDLMGDIADLGVEYLNAEAIAVERFADTIAVRTSQATHYCRALIIATGARLRKLGVPGEAELEHRGVSACADCDAPLYEGQDVVVVGGGDSALQEALVLAQFCRTVHLMVRSEHCSARPEWVEQVQSNPKIMLHLHSVVEAVRGQDGVEAVVVRTGASAQRREFACRGLFVYVGLVANWPVTTPRLQSDAAGFLLADADGVTAIDGVFAAGAVRAGFGGLLSAAIDDGQRAAASVLQYLQRHPSQQVHAPALPVHGDVNRLSAPATGVNPGGSALQFNH